jgi:hypothetical protein
MLPEQLGISQSYRRFFAWLGRLAAGRFVPGRLVRCPGRGVRGPAGGATSAPFALTAGPTALASTGLSSVPDAPAEPDATGGAESALGPAFFAGWLRVRVLAGFCPGRGGATLGADPTAAVSGVVGGWNLMM